MAKRRYTIQEIKDSLKRADGLKVAAARILGCTYQTVLNYIDKYPSLSEYDKELREFKNDLSERLISAVLISANNKISITEDGQMVLKEPITKDEIDTAFRHLKYKGKDRGYVERQEVTGQDGKDLPPLTVIFEDHIIQPGKK